MLRRAEAASEVMWHLVTHDAHGYSQPHRAGDGTDEELYLSDGERVVVHGGDYDCSESVRVAVNCALSGDYHGPITYMWTGCEREDLLAVGYEEISPWDAADGDILLTDGHTEMVIDMDGRLIQAGFRHSEDYDIHGWQGDQTGDESSWSDYDPTDWQAAFRYVGPEREDPAPAPAPHVETPEEKEARQMQPVSNEGGDVYRLYNPYSGAHHFTTSAGERDALVGAGWQSEGVAWTAKIGKYAIYRLYNQGNGDHLFTTSFDEAKACADAGWMYEGVPFFGSDDGAEVYRLYNPNSGIHHFTTGAGERDSLVAVGWQYEGVSFRA
jgi:hypothetical protein